jgi:hypothetical protein
LLPKKGNLEIFLLQCNANGGEDIKNERDEAEQQVINHGLENEASKVE